MNTRHIVAALVLAAAPLYAGSALAAVPSVEKIGAAALISCPSPLKVAKIFHFDKVVFMITGKLQAASPNEQPLIEALPFNTPLDIKIQDNPRLVANLKSKVLTFLGAAPTADNAASIEIKEVTYSAVVCPPSI
jgi:hypothetical protein